jgi:hypothetical protein
LGVDHQDAALAAPAAAWLSEHLGVPVAWQLAAKSGVNTREALQLLSESDLQPPICWSRRWASMTSLRSARHCSS